MNKLKGSVRQQTLARLRASERKPPLRATRGTPGRTTPDPVVASGTVRVQLHLDLTMHLDSPLHHSELRQLVTLLKAHPGGYAVDALCETLTEALSADGLPVAGFDVTASAWEVSR